MLLHLLFQPVKGRQSDLKVIHDVVPIRFGA